MDCNESSGGHVPLKLIDDLIKAGWEVLAGDFQESAYAEWKQRAYCCLEALLGPRHYYTVSLTTRVTQAQETNLLAGTGILTAARDLIFRERSASGEAGTGNYKVRSRESVSGPGGRMMRRDHGIFRSILNVTDRDVVEIETLAAYREEAASIVRKVLERQEVDSVDELDALTLKNLVGFLQTM